MAIIKQISSFIKGNKYEVVTSIVILSNLYQQWIPSQVYFIALGLFYWKYKKFHPRPHYKKTLYKAFIVLLWFSSIVGLVLDLRLVAFTFILFMTSPTNSFKWHKYKLQLLRCLFIGFTIVTLLNFFAKLIGYNYLDQFKDLYTMNRQFEFSGFGRFAMWTSCAGALSTMVFASYAFNKQNKAMWLKFFCYGMILVSLYVVMISASRSAFVLAIACSLLVIKMQTRSGGKLFRNLILIGITAYLFAPVLEDNSEAMMRKRNGFQITTKNTSRDELWGQRMDEFRSSPIWGIGFAAHGIGTNKSVGRNESGGSFISVLAQTGLVGFIIVLVIWWSATSLPQKIPYNHDVILTYGAFIFISLHCIIEGYMFQAGWYMCFITWLIVGVMIEVKTFAKNKYYYS